PPPRLRAPENSWRLPPADSRPCTVARRAARLSPQEVRVARITLVNPRFEVSCWGLEHALPFLGKRANMPVACLPLLAALTPAGHTVTLLDENVQALNLDRLARDDIVGLTGMIVQRQR